MNIIRYYLSNPSIDWSGAISVGSLNINAAASSNTALDFEVLKVPVLLKSVENTEVILKATIDSDIECEIYELGVYPAVFNNTSNGYDDKILANFDESWIDSLTLNELISSNYSSVSRIGSRSVVIPQTSVDFSNPLAFDLSGYSSLDEMSILYNVTATGADRIISITLSDNQLPVAGTKSIDITIPGTSLGYNKISVLLGNFSELNNFNGQVQNISISTTEDLSSAELNIDAIRLNDSDEVDPNFALVSRSLIGSVGGETISDYIKKPVGVEADIEYRVDISSL